LAGTAKDISRFGLGGYLVRLGFSAALVFATYNPSRFSFAHWVTGAFADGSIGPLHAVAGVALLIGWTVFVRTTWESIGALGLVLAGALLGALIWLLVDADLLSLDSFSTVIWLVLIAVALVLALGMSWGHMQRRASGQVDIDEVGN
jgi:hypothetical protein